MRASEAAGNGRDIVIESGLVYAAITAYLLIAFAPVAVVVIVR